MSMGELGVKVTSEVKYAGLVTSKSEGGTMTDVMQGVDMSSVTDLGAE